jgi:organic radical activating enzyme
MSVIELKEILWEITNKCSKNCEYCGSKNIINKENCNDKFDVIKVVLQRIIDFKQKYKENELSVVLTGGEPSEIDEETLEKVLVELKMAEIKTKILTNGKLFDVANIDILYCTDVIGLSINTINDIKNISGVFRELIDNQRKITIITNFGKHNVFDFEAISDFVVETNCLWQMQLTMGEQQLNKSGISFLMDKVNKAKADGVNIILADNMNCGKCVAGINSVGITYDGNIIGCLAERSFCKIIDTYGNLLSETLINIWENEFKDIRFSNCRKCCKDMIDYDFNKKNATETLDEHIKIKFKREFPIIRRSDKINTPSIILYGVGESQTFVYGVSDE